MKRREVQFGRKRGQASFRVCHSAVDPIHPIRPADPARKTTSKRRLTHFSNGFTLIELLVVIAIISLLVSILLPSLQKAKDLAKSVVCIANLKEISTMVFLYAHDYDGVFCLSSDDNNFWGNSHNGWAGEQLCGMFDLKNHQGQPKHADTASPYEYLPIFSCPATNGFCDWGRSEGGYGLNVLATYYYTDAISHDFLGDRPAPGGRMDQIQHPEYCFLYSEVIPNHVIGYNGTPPYSENKGCIPWWDGLSDRHLGGFNVVYWNGACETRNQEEFFDHWGDVGWEINLKFGGGY
ncbi:MAG: type II secretion system protein [Phycisphaerae bacterium]|nr:type II secretion system protein [Phycisphaerae bacterium]